MNNLNPDKVYNELRQIYCVKGAEFCRPELEQAWKCIKQQQKEKAHLLQVLKGIWNIYLEFDELHMENLHEMERVLLKNGCIEE